MKNVSMKNIFVLALAFMAIFASCTKEVSDNSGSEQLSDVELAISVDMSAFAQDIVTSKSSSASPTRYIVAVYSDEDYSVSADIFDGSNQSISSDGSFSAVLDRTEVYYCLFWADVEGDDHYNVDDLMAVSLLEGASPVESWSGKVTISGLKYSYDVALSRSVAKINLRETGSISAGSTLELSFLQPETFNVATNQIGEQSTSRTESIIIANGANGTDTDPLLLNSDNIYIFAPKHSQCEIDLSFKMDSENRFTVASVPFQANSATNVTGHYSTLSSL